MNPIIKLCNWYFSHRALPYWCILIIDCLSVYLTGLVVYYYQYGGTIFIRNFWLVSVGLVICIVIQAIAFFMFHTFQGVLRYSSFVDLHRLAYSNIVTAICICLLHQMQVRLGLSAYLIVPRFESVILIFFISTCMMWALRVVVKTLHDNYRGNDALQKVFIYGCMQGGIALAKSIRSESPVRYRLRGFITSDPSLDGSWLLGEQVHYDEDSVVALMQQLKVTTILVSPLQSDRFTNRTSLIDALIRNNIKIMMMPTVEEWDGHTELSHQQLKDVEIEDLLPREKIEVDMVAIGSMLRGKRILITGAAGSIGSEMARQVAKLQPSDLILIDQAETPMHDVRRWMANNFGTSGTKTHVETIVTSICKQERMERIFAQYRPEYVFHAAAYKHVPMMEDNPAEAVQNNIYGTRVIADLAVKYGTRKFVMISTDKAVNPTNVMGCSKRICEIYCQSLNKAIADGTLKPSETLGTLEPRPQTQFVTTRFGNVLGSNGSVIPIFREQIKKGGPVTVTHRDIIRYFMLIPEACRLVLEAGTMGKGGEIFVFDMGKPVHIADLAQRMINLSGAHSIEIKYTGLRDGEKLYEEVLNDAELTKPTCHPKIKVAAVREYPYELALQNEIALYNLSYTDEDMAIVKKMKEIVPEFKSQVSKYTILDN